MVDNTIATDLDVEETEESEAEEQDVISYQISYYPADLTLKGYLDKDDSGQLVIPDFQRSYIWDQVRASKLIESFLLGLPVPGVFLYKERDTNKLQIIDGQQRILSAIRFFRGRFGDAIFKLRKVHPRWNGKTFSELDESDRFQLSDAVLRATVVQQLDPQDDSSIFHIFERLNSGGINLTPMEIRKCVYQGRFYATLEELNNHKSWRLLVGKSQTDKRLRDVELCLRILALADSWERYEKPMKKFLNDYMISFKHLERDTLEGILASQSVEFRSLCDQIVEHLGPKPFHLRGRLNYAVMDSTMAVLKPVAEEMDNEFPKRFAAMLADETYLTDVTSNTSDERTLKRRFETATKHLLG